ncbi:anoctamin-7-like [Amphibalanus amphitrite]|uniref:anoctamin-7-like n=1 Tax=Amphibalanus amphitrite TaxID=1232801 RepID=UPI001C909CAC|nr:anoctamin-7-like [Amphibalanus amphitrite]
MSRSEKYELGAVDSKTKKKKYGSLDQGVSSSLTHIITNDSLEAVPDDGTTEQTSLLEPQPGTSASSYAQNVLQNVSELGLAPDGAAPSFEAVTITMPEEEEGPEEGDQMIAAADSSDQVPLLDPSPSPLDVRQSSSVTLRRSSLLVRSLRSIASFRKKRRSQTGLEGSVEQMNPAAAAASSASQDPLLDTSQEPLLGASQDALLDTPQDPLLNPSALAVERNSLMPQPSGSAVIQPIPEFRGYQQEQPEEQGLEEQQAAFPAEPSPSQDPLQTASPPQSERLSLLPHPSSSSSSRRPSRVTRSYQAIQIIRDEPEQPVEQRGSITGWLQRKLSGQRQGSVEDLATFAFDPASSGDPEAAMLAAAQQQARHKPLAMDASLTGAERFTALLTADPENQNNEYHIERRKDAQLPAEIDSCFFRDGKRRIDYILVYEDTTIQGKVRGRLAEKRFLKQEAWRGRFRANLRKAGLQMEEEIVPGPKKTIYFIKLHAPWDVLCTWAEELKMRAPLQPLFHMVRERITPRKSIGPQYLDGFLDSVTRMNVEDQLQMSATQMSPKMELFIARIVRPNMPHNWSEWVLKKLHIPNVMQQDVPNKPVEYFTCPFKKAKLDKFLGSEDQDNYFSTGQRIRIVYEILATSVFGKRKQGEVGIERLVDEGTYNAAFPLHDGDFKVPKDPDLDHSRLNARQILHEYWGRYSRWYKYQPLDHIREYFGEKIGIYFAWLGFYTGWLLPAAVIGLLVFMYGVITINRNDVANEICDNPGQFKMCPLCDYCNYWYLDTICAYAKIAYLFDHPGTVFYSVFVSFWAVTFLEYWKRKCATLSHHWDCMDYQEEEERPRPDFAARAPAYGKNPITGQREPTFPHGVRLKRIAAGAGIIVLMMSLVIIFIVAVIIYRVLVSIPLFQNPTFRSQAQAISSLSGAIVNLILIMCMGRVYEKLAYRLTVWEMHRTQSEFEDNLTFKVFVFQFINFYSSIFYIAFFKGRFVGYPGHYNHILGLRNEDCAAGGCLVELAQQLAVIMIGKQMVNNAQEIILPKLKAFWQNRGVKGMSGACSKTRWEEDYQLIDSEGLFQEYLEMVLQFGFITIFVAAFPLAPLFALLNNWVEIRLDAQKFLCETRRPVPERCANIGIWFTILETLAHLAVISNAFLIAFTSEFLPKMLYQYEMHWHLEGYVNFTMAYAPNSSDPDVKGDCRYRGFRDENGKFTTFYWRLLAVRLGFVILFEHVVFFICKMIDLVVPDVPESLNMKIKRERYLAKQALADASAIGTGGGDEEKDELTEPPADTLVYLPGQAETGVRTAL